MALKLGLALHSNKPVRRVWNGVLLLFRSKVMSCTSSNIWRSSTIMQLKWALQTNLWNWVHVLSCLKTFREVETEWTNNNCHRSHVFIHIYTALTITQLTVALCLVHNCWRHLEAQLKLFQSKLIRICQHEWITVKMSIEESPAYKH